MSAAAPTREDLRAKLQEWGPVVLLALIPALPLLVGSGLVNTRAGGDSPFLLVRVHQLVLNLRAGVFPVRWMPQAAYGLGYPFFNFYASLPYYLAAALRLLGVGYIRSIQWTQALGFVFAAMAIYGFSRELRHRRAASLLVAFVYACAPFHMVNVYVRGDSLSEFYAFVFFPLILWALLRSYRQLNACNAVWVALSFGGLIVTHNISAIIFSPFVLLYALLLVMRALRSHRSATGQARAGYRHGLYVLSGLGAGALLSAWCWLPALAERGNVYLEDMTTGYFHYALHFRGLDLAQRSLVFDWAITADMQPFCMGFIQAALAIAGLIAICGWWVRRRRVESQSAFFVLLLAVSTFMITPLSRPLWDHMPLLPLVQFPWRFLSVQALATSLVVAYLVPRQWRWEPVVAPLLGLAVLVTMMAGLHPERLLIHEADITAQHLMLYEYFTANVGTTIRNDYLPRWVDPRPYTSEALWQATAPEAEGPTKPAPIALEGQTSSANIVASKPTSEHWTVDVASPTALLAFHTYYYPGWEARIDGRPAKVEALPGLGYVGLRLVQGRHEVSLRLARTRVQSIAEILSALAGAAVVSILLLRRANHDRFVVATSVASPAAAKTKVVTTNLQGQRRTLGIIAAGSMMLVLLAIGIWLLPSFSKNGGMIARIAATEQLDLTMDFDRIPYLHHNPDGVRFGNVARLASYELSSEAVATGEALTVTTHWSNLERHDLVARVALVSPAQHLFGVFQPVAVNERAIDSEAVSHVLHVPESTTRGVYLLSIQVYSREGEVRPVTARGETLGTTYLLPIHVSGEVLASGDEHILQHFGERIALSSVQTSQQLAGTLEVTLTWRVLAPPPQNYKIALRLRDPSGWEVARLDTQPGYGFYPTSMWRPGELVRDRYSLSLDDGTPPDTEYSLDATLYEAASLRPIGSARIPNVAITYPTVRQGYPVLHRFGPALALSEVQLPKQEWEQGEELILLLKWAAVAQMERDYVCRITLLDQARTRVLQQTELLAPGYPSSLWPQEALVASRYTMRLPRDMSVGQYTVVLTVEDLVTGAEVGVFALYTPVRLVEAKRDFAIPQMQTPIGADFGGQVRLLGYNFQRAEKELLFTLHWQTLSAMTTDYKIFAHLFDPATERIVAQQDVLLGGEDHPTTRWVPEEVVSNYIALPLSDVPAGAYRLGLGLYHGAERLTVIAPPGFTVSADRLLLDQSIQVP